MKKVVYILISLYIVTLLTILFGGIYFHTRPVEKVGDRGFSCVTHNEVVDIIDSILDSRVTLELDSTAII